MLLSLLSRRSTKILALVLQLFVFFSIIDIGRASILLMRGFVEINVKSGAFFERLLLNNQTNLQALFVLPEDIYLTIANDMISVTSYVGICAIGLVRYIPMIVVLALLSVFLYKTIRHTAFSVKNARLLLYAGIICIATAVLAPVINYSIIPSIVNALCEDTLEIGVNLLGAPHLHWGIILIFCGGILQQHFEQTVCEK